MTTAWAHLPTAERIDRILGDFMCRPHIWGTPNDASDIQYVRGSTWGAAQKILRVNPVWGILMGAITAYPESDDIGNAWDNATDALAALVAWDDCAYILDLHPDVVRLMAASGNEPAILLEATVRAQAKLKP